MSNPTEERKKEKNGCGQKRAQTFKYIILCEFFFYIFPIFYLGTIGSGRDGGFRRRRGRRFGILNAGFFGQEFDGRGQRRGGRSGGLPALLHPHISHAAGHGQRPLTLRHDGGHDVHHRPLQHGDEQFDRVDVGHVHAGSAGRTFTRGG